MDSPYRASLRKWKQSPGYNELCSAHPSLPVYTQERFMALSFLFIAQLPGGLSQEISPLPVSEHRAESPYAKCPLRCWAAAPQQRDFYVTSSWQEALLPSLTSTSPGQLLRGRHRQKIMTRRGHTSARTDKQFCCDGHVAGSFLNTGWLG